jgi:sugar lactone lactonase YvrE
MIPSRSFLAFLSLGFLVTGAIAPVYGAGADDYDWSNVAGHISGLGHLDATGTNARFSSPSGVATDGAGNIYVADTANHIIRKITTSGTVTTIAGTAGVTGTLDGIGAAAEFDAPAGVAATSNGIVYVADTGNDTIRRISPDGTVTTIAGTPRVSGTTDGFTALFNAPDALAVDAHGAVFVADTLNNTIRKVTYDGDVSTVAGLPRTTGTANGVGASARFYHPSGIAFDTSGSRFLIADTQNDTIRELRYDGSVSTFAGTPRVPGNTAGKVGIGELNKPVGIAVVSPDVIYVTDSAGDIIRRVYKTGEISPKSHGGKYGFKGSANGHAGAARFNNPGGIAVGSAGSFYIADTGNNTIRLSDSNANISTFAGAPTVSGSANGTGTAAGFDYPTAVALSGSNTLYIADTDNDIIRKVTKEGVVTTFAGTAHTTGTTNGAGGIVRFSHPSGIVTDTNGNVYVADTNNDTIRMINPAGLVTAFAGTPDVSGTADGPAASASFNHPHGLAIDAAGDIYVADTGNDTIRVITSGTVTTYAGVPGLSGTVNGPVATARFDAPTAVVTDGTNGIFVADTQNQTIRRILSNGIVSTYAGSPRHRGFKDGVSKVARFDNPTGISADDHHRLFVTDAGDDTIREIEPDAKAVSTVITIGGTSKLPGSASGIGSDANFAEPHGIVATPRTGILYVADSLNNRIVRGIPPSGRVKVHLEGPNAVAAGAEWNVDGGPYYQSDAVVRNLTPGAHTINFKTIPNFTTPAKQIITVSVFELTTVTGLYTPETGSATVTISPQAAIDGGAEWKIEGAAYNSGATATGLTAGSHTVIFTHVTGYDTPAPQVITVPDGGNVTTTGTYNLRNGSLTVNLIPAAANTAGAEWNVDGGSEQSSGATVTGLSVGSHTVYFADATNYVTPNPQQVTVADQQTTVTTGTYTGIPILGLQEPIGTPLVNPGTVNFGPVVSGSTKSLQFAIVNAGTALLKNLSLSLTGPSAGRFAVTSLTSSSLAIGGTSTFTVSVTPIGLAALSGTLSVASNDSSSPFVVTLAASGTNGPVVFSGAAGSFAGLLSGSNNTVRGYAGLTLSTKGALTGKFYLDGVLTTVKGTFATSGQYTGTPSNVSMLLTSGSGGPLNPAGYQILSTATAVSGSVPYIAYHAAYTATQAVSEARKYTLLLSNTNTSTTTPQGTGYVTLTTPAKGGTALLSGKLADGTAFTFATFIASGPYGHQIMVFDSALYRSKGFLGGPLTFATEPETNLTGIFQWVNPGGQSKTLYPLGFNTLLDVDGAIYLPPVRNNQPIPLSSGTFTISDGGLPQPFSVPIYLTVYPAESVIVTSSTNPYKFKAAVNGVAGSFSGSFTHPVSKKTVTFTGLLYQNNNDAGAAGYFVGPILSGTGVGTATSGTSQSGNVQLEPSGQ